MKKNHLYRAALLYLLFQFATLFASAQEVVAYMTIVGARSGQIKGTSTVNGNQDKIECIGFSYTAKSERNIGSSTAGMGSGKVSTADIVITIHFDAASPALIQAFLNNENLSSVTIEFYKRDRTGKETLGQTIKLTNAGISQFFQFAGTIAPGTTASTALTEEITFSAQRVEFVNGEATTGTTTGTATGTGLNRYDIKENKKQ